MSHTYFHPCLLIPSRFWRFPRREFVGSGVVLYYYRFTEETIHKRKTKHGYHGKAIQPLLLKYMSQTNRIP